MLFATILLLCAAATAAGPLYVTGYAALLLLVLLPFSHLVQFHLDTANRGVTLRLLPLDQAAGLGREVRQALVVCLALFAAHAGGLLAALAGLVPVSLGQMLLQSGRYLPLLLAAAYLLLARGRVSLPGDILFAGLLVTFYRMLGTLSVISDPDAIWHALAPEGVIWPLLTLAYLAVALAVSRAAKARLCRT